MSRPQALSEGVALRRHITNRWRALGQSRLARLDGAGEAGNAQGLRRRLLTRIHREVETKGGVVDRQRIQRLLDDTPEVAHLATGARDHLRRQLVDELTGWGPLAPLMRDSTVSDILVNGAHDVWVERFGKLEKSDLCFENETRLRSLVARIVATQGARLDDSTPHVDLRLDDGSRLHAVLPPISRQGLVVSIRRRREVTFQLHDLVAFGTLSLEMGELLQTAVREKKNIVVSGGAGAGKTTLLNVLSRAIPAHERLVLLEETSELSFEHPHVIALEARRANAEGRGTVDLRQLVKNALRMRADRIVVGEVRGAEAFDMLQAMNVGHDGSLTTVHANSPRDALQRLESLVLMAGTDLPSRAVRGLLGAAIHLVVQMARLPDGGRRLVSISKITTKNGEPSTEELFAFDHSSGQFIARSAGRSLSRGDS